MTSVIPVNSVPFHSILHDEQLEDIRNAIQSVPWKNKIGCHVHDWALVVVVDHRNLDPVDMFVLGQRLELIKIRPQAMQFVGADGSLATALVIQRMSPGIELNQMHVFLKMLLSS